MENREPLLAFPEAAASLVEIARSFYARGWALGTSGNYSAVIGREPLRVAITATGLDKGQLTADQIVEVDADGAPLGGSGRASDEVALHLTIARRFDAGAVLHTHSVWSTILSEVFAGRGGVAIEGFEMLKGLEGVRTHAHREWLPIFENSQDLAALSREMEEKLAHQPGIHGFLLRRHGLYTWGRGLAQAKRHVEILEFLLEVLGREYCAGRGQESA